MKKYRGKQVDVVLDVLERRLRENPRADHRSVIVHFANSTEAQVARIKRLGAVVEASDVRPAVKEQIESLGAKFVDVPYETDEEREIARTTLEVLGLAHTL